jgi:hypothetical protein
MKKTKETNIALLAPANSRNDANVLHSTEFTKVIYQFNPTDRHRHTVTCYGRPLKQSAHSTAM